MYKKSNLLEYNEDLPQFLSYTYPIWHLYSTICMKIKGGMNFTKHYKQITCQYLNTTRVLPKTDEILSTFSHVSTSETQTGTRFSKKDENVPLFPKIRCWEIASIVSYREYAKIAWYPSKIGVLQVGFGRGYMFNRLQLKFSRDGDAL